MGIVRDWMNMRGQLPNGQTIRFHDYWRINVLEGIYYGKRRKERDSEADKMIEQMRADEQGQ